MFDKLLKRLDRAADSVSKTDAELVELQLRADSGDVEAKKALAEIPFWKRFGNGR